MLSGEKVVLTALDRRNAETVLGWINDPAVNRYMLSGHVPLTLSEEMAFYERSETSPEVHNFEIHVADDMRLIGHCGLIDVDVRNGHAEVGIMIGDLSAQNQGFGRDAIVTLLRFGFGTLRLNLATISCRADNERGLHLYRSIGFRDAGRFREHDYAEGRFFDLLMFDMLAAEFAERYSSAR